jgi:hypothetical protein
VDKLNIEMAKGRIPGFAAAVVPVPTFPDLPFYELVSRIKKKQQRPQRARSKRTLLYS